MMLISQVVDQRVNGDKGDLPAINDNNLIIIVYVCCLYVKMLFDGLALTDITLPRLIVLH